MGSGQLVRLSPGEGENFFQSSVVRLLPLSVVYCNKALSFQGIFHVLYSSFIECTV